MAEDIASDADILLIPAYNPKSIDFFNNTNNDDDISNLNILNLLIDSREVESKLKSDLEIVGVAPRWYLEARCYN